MGNSKKITEQELAVYNKVKREVKRRIKRLSEAMDLFTESVIRATEAVEALSFTTNKEKKNVKR